VIRFCASAQSLGSDLMPTYCDQCREVGDSEVIQNGRQSGSVAGTRLFERESLRQRKRVYRDQSDGRTDNFRLARDSCTTPKAVANRL
jgi:hypothetical protein